MALRSAEVRYPPRSIFFSRNDHHARRCTRGKRACFSVNFTGMRKIRGRIRRERFELYNLKHRGFATSSGGVIIGFVSVRARLAAGTSNWASKNKWQLKFHSHLAAFVERSRCEALEETRRGIRSRRESKREIQRGEGGGKSLETKRDERRRRYEKDLSLKLWDPSQIWTVFAVQGYSFQFFFLNEPHFFFINASFLFDFLIRCHIFIL